MGLYINTTTDGTVLPRAGKVALLLADGGTIVPTPQQWQENLVCVVCNGVFEAAAYAYSPKELEVFSDITDTRDKTWLIYPSAKELAK